MIYNKRNTTPRAFSAGPYLARIINNTDPKYMGTLEVQLLRDVGATPNANASTIHVRYLPPFYGVTSIDHLGSNDTHDDTQKSYGMWMVPPDVGAVVVVIFIEGDMKLGYWIGCVQDDYMNFMIPGLAATELHNDGSGKKIVSEFNKKINDAGNSDPTKNKKPVHPFQSALELQGLHNDETRGITTSSARRETPSQVFGISTPGPVDRRSSAPRGNVGKTATQATGVFVSRLGGSTFVMDDGDSNFLRKKHASAGPPNYASVENEESDGLPEIPHNELIRIRTRTGHQILLHNSEDLIYIANSRGTAWIELTSNGKIDIWAADSISMHTKKDFNITADQDINLSAGRNINLLAESNLFATATANYEIKAGADGKLSVGGSTNILSGGNHIESAAAIHMNGPMASAAVSALRAPRVPTAEPWDGHENYHDEAPSSIIDPFKKIGK